MTTSGDKLKDRIAKQGNSALKTGVQRKHQGDPSRVYPSKEYIGEPSINLAATGKTRNQLSGCWGIPGVSVAPEGGPAIYPNCQTDETPRGHVIEMDDTRGQERILVKHRTGAGIEMRADGSIIISTTHNQITVVNGDNVVRVSGNAKMIYEGNLDVEVAGDYNVNVKGNMFTNVQGDHITNCDNRSSVVEGNSGDTVKGHRSVTSLATNADLTMGNRDIVTKGELDIVSSGTATLASTGTLKLSSEGSIVGTATDNMRLGASKLYAMGASGTIGGESMTMYCQNIFGTSGTFTAGFTAPAFHGDLNGTAAQSNVTASQNYGDPAGGGGTSGTAYSLDTTATNTTETLKPTSALMSSYTQSTFGVNDIQIDLGDHLKNNIDRSTKTNGKAKSEQTTAQIRSTLKDPANLADQTYTADAVAQNKLNPEFIKNVPTEVGRIVSKSPSASQVRGVI